MHHLLGTSREWINLSVEAYHEQNSVGVGWIVTRTISIRIWEGLKKVRSDSGQKGSKEFARMALYAWANREKGQVVSCRGGRRFTLPARSLLATRKPKWRCRAAFIATFFASYRIQLRRIQLAARRKSVMILLQIRSYLLLLLNISNICEIF